jgi:hypothetical protein
LAGCFVNLTQNARLCTSVTSNDDPELLVVTVIAIAFETSIQNKETQPFLGINFSLVPAVPAFVSAGQCTGYIAVVKICLDEQSLSLLDTALVFLTYAFTWPA